MSVASGGQMETGSTSQHSERVTQQPAKLLDVVDAYVASTTLLRNVTCELKAVTADMWAIGMRRPDGKQMLLHRVSVSRAL